MIEPTWSLTVGAMIDEGATAYWQCGSCSTRGRVDLERVAAHSGRSLTLWDLMCRCRECSGVVTFSAAFRAGNWPIQLQSERGKLQVMETLDAVWWEKRAKNAENPPRGGATGSD